MSVEVGEVLKGKVTGITSFGAFVELPDGSSGMVHISEVSNSFIKDIRDELTEEQEVTVKVLEINEKGRIGLSIKKALPENKPQTYNNKPRNSGRQRGKPNVWTGQTSKYDSNNMTFEEMLSSFKTVSEEKMSDLKRSNIAKRGSTTPKRGGGNSR
ncbi:MAG TPA: S1 RNA-binding domain-containing protein [Oscillospiraceae bacterium]|nr:S1 RNA-binding domain-containing protein [Oscillospiraceae bacterium]